jgi:rubrerythrin
MQKETALDILKNALLLERRARAFYGKLAEQTPQPAVREFFTLMAAEEDKHIQVLSEQFRAYREGGTFAANDHGHQPSPDFASTVLSARMKSEIAAADFEAAAIAAALSMERRAVKAYSERAEAATDPEEQALYRWLANWETEHLEFLAKLDRELIEDVWNDSHFWPL